MKTYRIETERLVIRPWSPADAPLLKEAVDRSVEYLRPWLPWARHEPQTIAEKIELLRGFRGKYDLDQDFVLAIFDREERRVLGGSGLHTRVGPHEREVGYWVRVDETGAGICTEAVRAISQVALEIEGIRRLEIRCEPENRASMRVAEKCEYRHETTLPKRMLPGLDHPRDTAVWSLFPEDLSSRSWYPLDLRAFDAVGKEIGGGDAR